jgi:alkyl hydroperoxide reductase subunit AhpC
MLNLGETFPNFKAESTIGSIDLYEYLGSDWGLIFSNPSVSTPVCTTEIGRLSQLTKEFDRRNVKVLLISCKPVEDYNSWLKDVTHYSGCKVGFPFIGDQNGQIANKIGILDMVSIYISIY